ncbi:hypothetical protein, partial [Peribacillus sp. CSMR9]|uniref:hypothetical protein n=1 Tax=Peribacillus sp. CSMR9 TaxID=2981350 RepID=UPI002954AFF0
DTMVAANTFDLLKNAHQPFDYPLYPSISSKNHFSISILYPLAFNNGNKRTVQKRYSTIWPDC